MIQDWSRSLPPWLRGFFAYTLEAHGEIILMLRCLFSDLRWNADMMILPGTRGPVPLRNLSYALTATDETDKTCAISNARSGEVLVEFSLEGGESLRFSELQALILNAKLNVLR